MHRFGDVMCLDVFLFVEIRDRARNPEDLIVRPRRQPQFRHGLFQERFAAGVQAAEAPDIPVCHGGVGDEIVAVVAVKAFPLYLRRLL